MLQVLIGQSIVANFIKCIFCQSALLLHLHRMAIQNKPIISELPAFLPPLCLNFDLSLILRRNQHRANWFPDPFIILLHAQLLTLPIPLIVRPCCLHHPKRLRHLPPALDYLRPLSVTKFTQISHFLIRIVLFLGYFRQIQVEINKPPIQIEIVRKYNILEISLILTFLVLSLLFIWINILLIAIIRGILNNSIL